MNCKLPEFGYSASALKRSVILHAGEWLERAKLKRGRNVYEDEPGRVEGVPEKDQLPEVKPPVVFETTVAGEAEFRTVARPQVLKEMADG